jgi:hypothetical protein
VGSFAGPSNYRRQIVDTHLVITSSPFRSLSAEAFDAIVSSLKSDNGSRLHEQRGAPRVGVRGRVEVCEILPSGRLAPGVFVWVRDLSADGIGILHAGSMKPGTRFVARLPRGNAQSMELTYEVTNMNAVARGLYTIGANLVDTQN